MLGVKIDYNDLKYDRRDLRCSNNKSFTVILLFQYFAIDYNSVKENYFAIPLKHEFCKIIFNFKRYKRKIVIEKLKLFNFLQFYNFILQKHIIFI